MTDQPDIGAYAHLHTPEHDEWSSTGICMVVVHPASFTEGHLCGYRREPVDVAARIREVLGVPKPTGEGMSAAAAANTAEDPLLDHLIERAAEEAVEAEYERDANPEPGGDPLDALLYAARAFRDAKAPPRVIAAPETIGTLRKAFDLDRRSHPEQRRRPWLRRTLEWIQICLLRVFARPVVRNLYRWGQLQAGDTLEEVFWMHPPLYDTVTVFDETEAEYTARLREKAASADAIPVEVNPYVPPGSLYMFDPGIIDQTPEPTSWEFEAWRGAFPDMVAADHADHLDLHARLAQRVRWAPPTSVGDVTVDPDDPDPEDTHA